MPSRGTFVTVLFFVASIGLGVASAEQDTAAEKPPSGTWGESIADGNDKGLKKATGSPYNYTHIAISCVAFVVIGAGLVLLIRRQTADRRNS